MRKVFNYINVVRLTKLRYLCIVVGGVLMSGRREVQNPAIESTTESASDLIML